MFASLGTLAMFGAKPRIPVHVAQNESRPYNAQRYFKQFRFVSRPVFLLNVEI
jgi:hypothetical protein